MAEGASPDEQFPSESTQSVVVERQHLQLRVLAERHVLDESDLVVTQVQRAQFPERREVFARHQSQSVVGQVEVGEGREVAEYSDNDLDQLVVG